MKIYHKTYHTITKCEISPNEKSITQNDNENVRFHHTTENSSENRINFIERKMLNNITFF